ncbi:Protein kintoun [Lonchura striata]|uniref:Protein kintoun n=1 Tax=Lonchura striata TaxID=40157 RepID=A0A218UJ45_9PASE|nr:Protein kintoun [Lonchura striata domestica]
MAGAGRLQDLDLSAEEAERLKRAFRDEKFRALFAEYAAELTDPEQRRLYEEEVAALERQRGVEVRFVHPTPGFVLRTSQDGSRRCYINVCSNALMGEPRARAERGGQRWELPYSLAPGREELRPGGRRRLLYDVVFHPAALRLAARSARFRRLLRDTALEAVESRCGVRLDRNNATVLRGVSYKGAPQAPDYRHCRDSAPSPVPRELVVTVELPLLRSAEQAELEIRGRELRLDSRCPAYRLRLRLPYDVDESGGRAAFHRAQRQLQAEPATNPSSEPFAEPTTDPSSEPPAGPTTDPRSEPFTEPPATDPPAEPEPPTESPGPALPCSGAASPIASPEPAMPTGDTPPQAFEGHPSEVAACPPFRARQDEASLTLLLLVPGIQPRSLRGDVGTHHYSLRFRTDTAAFALFLRFPAALLCPESSVSVSAHNAVVGLAKAPGSTGLWDKFSFGLHPSALQERLFVSEENVDGFLGTAFCPSPCSQSALESQPLIEVLDVTEDRIQIRVEVRIQEQHRLIYVLQQDPPQERDGQGMLGSSGGALAGKTDSNYPETKADTECPAAEGGAAGSSPAPTAGTMGKAGCASHHCLQHEPPATSSAIPGGAGRTEPDLESAAAAGDTAPAPGSGKAGKLQGDGDGDGEAFPGLGSRAGSPVLREVNPEDGSVRILRDHRTRCPVQFHSPLLYQLD